MQVLIQSIIFNSLFSDVEKADRIADVIANHFTLNSDIPQAEKFYLDTSRFYPFSCQGNTIGIDCQYVNINKEVYEEMERRYKVYEELVEEARSCFANLKAHSTECEGILINSNADIIDTVNEWMDKLYEQVTIKDQGITPDGKADPNPNPKVSLPLTEELSQNSFLVPHDKYTGTLNNKIVQDFMQSDSCTIVDEESNIICNEFLIWLKERYCMYTVKENIQNNADQYRKGR